MSFILGARRVAPPPPLDPPPLTTSPTGTPPPEDLTISLLGVNGDVIPLTDDASGLGVLSTPPPSGFWLPDYDRTLQATPGVDGARYGDVTATPRTVGLTVRFDLPDVSAVRTLSDRIARAVNPKRGLAGFLVAEADGTSRLIAGQYAEGERVEHLRTLGHIRIDLDVADTPHWTDAPGSELPERTWTAGTAADFYPYTYDTVRADTVVGDPVDIDNTGHEDLPPDWLLRGPASGLLLANDTTGEQLQWTGTLAAGKWLAFVTQAGLQEVVDSDGVSRFHELDQTPEPAFWPLVPGVNTVRTVVEGVEAGTSVTLLPQARRWLVQG